MEAQVITINGKKHPVNFSYRCVKALSDRMGHNSPITTLTKLGNVFSGLVSAYEGLEETQFDKIDTEKITYEQIELFKDLVECAINAAGPKKQFVAPNEDPFKLFVQNPEACGYVFAQFFKANVPQESAQTKKTPVKKKTKKE